MHHRFVCSRRQCLATGLAATLSAGLSAGLGALALPALGSGLAPARQDWTAGLRQRRLRNGLELLSLPDAPGVAAEGGRSVAVQVWYRVGARDDPPGRSGMAHLFEHLMFRRTRHLADGDFDRLTEDVGGSNNAFTAEDLTVFHSQVPSQHLEPLLWAEAERMANLRPDQALLDAERAVLLEEIAQRLQGDPHAPLFHALPGLLFAGQVYERPVIGAPEELAAISLVELQDFHARHYRPDKALLVVSGRFDEHQLDQAVDHWFGSIALPPEPPAPRPPATPAALASGRRRLAAPPGSPPAAALVWRAPPAASPDTALLRLIEAVLGLGDSARLLASLGYQQGLAQGCGFELLQHADAGMMVAHAIAAGGGGARAAEQLAGALERELQRLASEPLLHEELDKARALLLGQTLLARETAEGRGLQLGEARLLRGDAAVLAQDLGRWQQLGPQELQRGVRRLLLQAPRLTVLYEPALLV